MIAAIIVRYTTSTILYVWNYLCEFYRANVGWIVW